MARLRSNHRQSNKVSSTLMRFITFIVLAVIGMWYAWQQYSQMDISGNDEQVEVTDPASRSFLPTSTTGAIVHHNDYSLSYVESHEQAEWVAYRLTRENLKKPNVKRSKRFNPDYDVNSRSAFHRDYTGSGFTRGHLAPAGDMAHSKEAMEESFFMSNISPQSRGFNNGAWKELEETVRDWAFSDKTLYVVTGPILSDKGFEKIGKNKVSVPKRFYKILLDIERPKEKGIAFIMPHGTLEEPLSSYAVPIDKVEEETGIDFFPDLLNDSEEEKLESSIDLNLWKFSDKRFRLRLEKWNHQ